MRNVIVSALALLLLALQANTDTRPVLHFAITGQSNAGNNGRGTVAVPGAYYYAPQATGVNRVVPLTSVRRKWGVEVPFAAAIVEACPGYDILISKRYLGGTSIVGWRPSAPNAAWASDMRLVGDGDKKPQYPLVIATAQAAGDRFGADGVAGILFIQNEKDSRMPHGAALYEGELRTLIGAWRQHWGDDDLPVVVMDSHTSLDLHGGQVHEAIVAVAGSEQGVRMVASRDLTTTDGIHFDNLCLETLGQRMAAAWLAMEGCE